VAPPQNDALVQLEARDESLGDAEVDDGSEDAPKAASAEETPADNSALSVDSEGGPSTTEAMNALADSTSQAPDSSSAETQTDGSDQTQAAAQTEQPAQEDSQAPTQSAAETQLAAAQLQAAA
jgi:hypothetical protein